MDDNYFFKTKSVSLYHRDCLEILKTFEDNFIDTVITDPPYFLNFQQHKWDCALPKIEIWQELLRVCKPGSLMMVFGGTRTYHRLACLIEDSGWEMVDCLSWVYSSGMPKGLNISNALRKNDNSIGEIEKWDGYSTALKPAWEPILLCAKPCNDVLINSALKWGVCGLNIDRCRIGLVNNDERGRFPSNFLLTHHPECKNLDNLSKCHNDCPIKMLDDQSGILKSGSNCVRRKEGRFLEHGGIGKPGDVQTTYGDVGTASRFFYCSKADSYERWFFCTECNDSYPRSKEKEHLHDKQDIKHLIYHPTVKPQRILKYLVKLSNPPNESIVLDPFMGSGSMVLACLDENRKFIGIDQDETYCKIAKARTQSKIEEKGNLFS